jgi:hypothetical protein
LTTIGPSSRISHSKGIWSVEASFCAEFVFKISTPNGFTTGTITWGRISLHTPTIDMQLTKGISRLQHELLDNSVKHDTIEIA